jgi:hypothetical protein
MFLIPQATIQLSHNSCCISEVVPIVSQILENQKNISSEDRGVITLKRNLYKSVEQRMGHFEELEQYAVATLVDPRFYLSLA